MSFTHQSLAWNLDLPSAACKLVLMGLASYANEEGYCYPGQATLAQRTCQTERSVRTHLAWLEAQGYIKRQHRDRLTGRTSDEYLITIGTTPPEKFSAGPTGKKRQTPPEKFSAGSIYESVSKNIPEVENFAETLYQAYPKHVGKASALKAISKALKAAPFATLMDAVQEYAYAVKATVKADDMQFVPAPGPWFNGGHWEDDRAMWWKGKRRPQHTAPVVAKPFPSNTPKLSDFPDDLRHLFPDLE